jgi:hypothetical protein
MIQTIDFRFEILFLLGVLVSIICLVVALVQAVSSRWSAAKRLLRVLGIGWVTYLCVVFSIAAATPQRIVPMNQDLCWDEMCFAVVNARTMTQLDRGIQPARANDIFYVVTVRVSSHARGRPQSEQGLHALLWSSGHYYGISSPGQSSWDVTHPETSAALTTRVWPGHSFMSDQVFEVPEQTPNLGLVLTNGFGPGYFVIGESPLFHKPTVLRLSQ